MNKESLKSQEEKLQNAKIDKLDNLYAGCEEDNKCCKVLDIKVGIQILCVLGILGAAGSIFNVFAFMNLPINNHYTALNLFIICYWIALIPSIIGAFFYFKFLKDDTKETREGVVKGTLYSAVTYVATMIVLTV